MLLQRATPKREMDAFTSLLAEHIRLGRSFSPTAVCLQLYLRGDGRLQIGSVISEKVDRVWLRPRNGGQWSVVKAT